MAQQRVCIGIDFGTSNSSIAYVLPDPRDSSAQKVHVESVKVQVDDSATAKSDRLPTIIAESMDRRSRKALLGWGFFQQFFGRKKKKATLLRHGENFFRSVKSDLGTLRVYPHAFSTKYQTPEQVASAIIGQLLDEAQKQLPNHKVRKSKVVISVPASLGALGREHTLAAAIQAGLSQENVELIDEPVAALLDFLNSGKAAGILEAEKVKNILVFDYGGGTLDLSLVRARFDSTSKATGLRVRNLAISQYRRLGGDDIDRAIMDQIVWPQIKDATGNAVADFPSGLRQSINDTLAPTVARRLKEGICRKVSESITSSGRRAKRSIKHVEQLLTTFDEVDLPRAYIITSEDFEAVMRPFLSLPSDNESDEHPSLLRPIREVLERGGLEPSRLDALVLHGGSCRNPFVRELLSEHVGDQNRLFGHAVIEETPDLDTSVARGAALTSYWRHERKTDIVPPIIAEEIGILTLDDMPVKLLDGGASVPFPNEDEIHRVNAEFYVPQSNLAEMVVPFYTGDRDKRITDSVLVPLPPGTNRGTPVSIKLRVDRNKTLHWWYSIGKGTFLSARSINDPSTSELPTPENKVLYAHRRAMREELTSSGSLPYEFELKEISLLNGAGKWDEAELAAHDMIRRNGLNASLANWLGLIAANKNNNKEALLWHGRAAELNPHDPILVGNYGWLLADTGRGEEGEAKMREALAMNSHLVYLYSRIGDLYRSQGDEARATREYNEGLRLARDHALRDEDPYQSWRMAAGLYHRLGDYERAAEARARANSLMQSKHFGGDHRHRIAGPDSGVSIADDVDQ